MRKLARKQDIPYLIAFIVISLIFVFPFVHTGKLIAEVDWLFHASRVEQLYINLRKGTLLTFVATNTFHHSGSGSFLFYPYVFLYPWALLRFVFNPITSFYLWKALMTCTTLFISYYCMKAFSKNRMMSFIFALVYAFNTYRIYLGFAVFGEYIASAFLPLAFYGFYVMFFKRNDIEKRSHPALILAIGMSLLIYSHLVSVFITVEIFLLVLVIYSLLGNFQLVVSRWKDLLKSIFLTILLCLPLCFLFFTNFIGKNITSTNLGVMLYLIQPFSMIISSSLDNAFGPNSVGIYLIITCFFGGFFINKMRKSSKVYLSIYVLGILLLLLSTSNFPWYLFQHSLLGNIQIPYRYLEFAAFFLSIIFAKCSMMLLSGKLKLNNKQISCLVLCVTILGYWVPMQDKYTELRTALPSQLYHHETEEKLDHSILNKDSYNKQFNYIIRWGEDDYYPQKAANNARSIDDQITYLGGKRLKNVSTEYLPNSVVYKLNLTKIAGVDLPFISYNNTYVKVNGKKVDYHLSKRGTVLIPKKAVKKGTLKIQVGYAPSVLFYVCIMVSVITWVVIIVKLRKSRLAI